ncbi:MAG: sigma 54-interacting transcriptional regulator [Candidatus Thorarchaeota archaeon]
MENKPKKGSIAAFPKVDSILNASSNGIICTDTSGKINFINKQAKSIFRFNKKISIGAFISDVLPLSGPLALKCLKTLKPQLGHHILGQQVSLVLNVTPIGEKGKLQGVMCSFQKMEQFENAAKKLESYKQLNTQLEAIFESSSDGIYVCDGGGKVIRINKASEKLNGVRAKDVIGKRSEQIINEGVIDRSAVLEVLSTKRKVSIMQYLRRTKKYVLVTATPAFDDEGNIFLVVLNERDLTQLNIMAKKLRDARMVTEKYKDELLQMSMRELTKEPFIAKDKTMRRVLDTVSKLSRLEASNVLILGESGTGKGVLAKMIHKNSKRRENPFIQINCAAVPENLLEAELFGYEKGAFTGASDRGKIGLFELAHTGTLFLDEIGDLPFSVQAKLLKYLDDHEILRLGGIRAKKIECKVIAATNQDLASLVKKKRFREDLYYRLNTFTIQIPPLRDRRDDIPELVNHYLSEYNKMYRTKKKIGSTGFKTLSAYSFPGNIRELKNIIRKAVVFSEENLLDSFFSESIAYHSGKIEAPPNDKTERTNLNDQIMAVEKEIVKNAMVKCKTTREMARLLGVSQPTIVRKLQKHSLSPNAIQI